MATLSQRYWDMAKGNDPRPVSLHKLPEWAYEEDSEGNVRVRDLSHELFALGEWAEEQEDVEA